MGLLRLIGVLFVIGGAILLWKRPTYTTHRNVMQIGELKATVDEQQSIPPWIGGAAVGVGLALLLAGGRRRA